MAESFELIEGLPKGVKAIAAGEGHTAVLSSRGDLYIFGDGKHGKLGPPTQSNEFEPFIVDKFKAYTVHKVVCGGCQTIVLAQKKSADQKHPSGSDEDIGSTSSTFVFAPRQLDSLFARRDTLRHATSEESSAHQPASIWYRPVAHHRQLDGCHSAS